MPKIDLFFKKISNDLKRKEIERWIANPHLHELSERDLRLIRVFESLNLKLEDSAYLNNLTLERIALMESRITRSKFTKTHHTHLAAKIAADHVLNSLKKIRALKEKNSARKL